MRGVSSCLFRRFTQGKSILFQEGAKVSGACRPNDFPGLLRTKVSLPLPRLSRACSSAHAGANSGGSWVEMGPGPKRAQTPCRRLHAGGQNAGHSPHALAKHPVTTGHLSVVQNPTILEPFFEFAFRPSSRLRSDKLRLRKLTTCRQAMNACA